MIYFDFLPSFVHYLLLFRKCNLIAHLCFNGARMSQFMDMLAKTSLKDEDSKAIKIPPFSDGTEWEPVVFELECSLEKYWKHDDLDIVDYLKGIQQNCAPELIAKADKLSTTH
jgi:hypothetical protein